MRLLLRRASSLSVCALLAASTRAQTVHVVSGAPDALDLAILAAADGDTLLVHGGPYNAANVNGKSLRIVAEPSGAVGLSVLRIENLAMAQTVIVSGFGPSSLSNKLRVEVTQCAGAVRLENLVAREIAQPALRVDACDNVAVTRCSFRAFGSTTLDVAGCAAGACVASSVACYDSSFDGGRGADGAIPGFPLVVHPATAGGSAFVADASSTLFVSGGAFHGGDGGTGTSLFCPSLAALPPTDGAAGGAGLELNGASAYALDATLAGGNGGAGGTGGQCSAGGPVFSNANAGAAGVGATAGLIALGGARVQTSAASPVREGLPLSLDVLGTPGDPVWLAISRKTRWLLFPGYSGVFLFGPSVRRVFLGMLPGSGVLSVQLPIAMLPMGVDTRTFYLQPLARHSNGAFVLGAPLNLVVLDQAF